MITAFNKLESQHLSTLFIAFEIEVKIILMQINNL